MEARWDLAGRYRDDDRTQEIIGICRNTSQSFIQLNGLCGAQDCFVLAGCWMAAPGQHLLIAADKEESEAIFETLYFILGEKNVLYLPDSFKRPGDFQELQVHQALQRSEVVNRITAPGGHMEVIVTYPEALFEKVVDPEAMSRSRIHITVDEPLDVDFLIDVLLEYGFVREDFVTAPGQFSIRGGIVDLFTYGNTFPYRIELDDERVESIRTFEPATQISNRKIGKVSIIPNIHTRFESREKTSITSLLSGGAIYWWKDAPGALDRLQACVQKANLAAEQLTSMDQDDRAELLREKAFHSVEDIESLFQKGGHLFLGSTIVRPGIQNTPPEKIHQLTYHTKPQPHFNKQFPLLIADIHQCMQQHIQVYISADSSKQLERFEAIFEDLEANVKYQSVLGPIHGGFIDENLKLAVYTDHQIFDRYHAHKTKTGFTPEQAMHLRLLRELVPGDYIVHIDHGVGKYSGLEKLDINGHIQEAVRIIYKNNDLLYVGINSLHKLSKFSGKDGQEPQLNKLGSETWKALKAKTKKKVKDIARDLILLYAKRRASKGHAFAPDGYMQNELEASFLYEDTPDQLKATQDVKQDMELERPMDRLICGDVGFGKTEVAVRAVFKAILDGKQAAVLVPTTILALQHYRTFGERLKDFKIRVDYLNRFRSTTDRKKILQDLENGSIEVIIGTHALLNKDTKFKDLGLLVIDEEQKFGVSDKEKLRNLKVHVDTLTLTATPIPRTLQFSLMGARDLSIMRTPPPNRQPIHTESRSFDPQFIKEVIEYELLRNGQVFLVHNRVQQLPELATMVMEYVPEAKVIVAHGQLEAHQLEERLIAFIEGKHNVLVCTNIIETGLDIPNANTIIIMNSHQFGMSDLHQLRGRVGRSNRKAYCYLVHPPVSVLSSDARKRLKTLEEFNDLGSGFHIAMRDLDIRGAGNILGGEQSGFIGELGYEAYQKILEEAVLDLKETEFSEIFAEEILSSGQYVREVAIETDTEMRIPDTYVTNVNERLILYQELDRIESEEALQEYLTVLTDRFGPVPTQVYELADGLRLRWICAQCGFERVVLKNQKLRCFFPLNPKAIFYDSKLFQQFMAYIVQSGTEQGWKLQQSQNSLSLLKDRANSLHQAYEFISMLKHNIDTNQSV